MARPKQTPPSITPVSTPEDPNLSQELADEMRVRDAIVEAVLSQKLPPGTRLVETPLCEAFGVNRSLLRRALVRLALPEVRRIGVLYGAASKPQEAALIAAAASSDFPPRMIWIVSSV